MISLVLNFQPNCKPRVINCSKVKCEEHPMKTALPKNSKKMTLER